MGEGGKGGKGERGKGERGKGEWDRDVSMLLCELNWLSNPKGPKKRKKKKKITLSNLFRISITNQYNFPS